MRFSPWILKILISLHWIALDRFALCILLFSVHVQTFHKNLVENKSFVRSFTRLFSVVFFPPFSLLFFSHFILMQTKISNMQIYEIWMLFHICVFFSFFFLCLTEKQQTHIMVNWNTDSNGQNRNKHNQIETYCLTKRAQFSFLSLFFKYFI